MAGLRVPADELRSLPVTRLELLGVFELLELDKVRGMVMERQAASSIRQVAIEKGMTTMVQDGLGKVFLGETTLEEVVRVAL
jgi:general secretion pathway protein E